MQDALKKIAKHEMPIQTSSRTDAGVNAFGHPILFTIDRKVDKIIL